MNRPPVDRQLVPRQRIVARRIARTLYLGRPPIAWKGKSYEDVENEVRTEYGSILSLIFISLLVKAITEFLWHWIENEILSPGMTYTRDEPGWSEEIEDYE